LSICSKIGKYSGLTPGHNDDPVTQPRQMTHWPGDPVPTLIHVTTASLTQLHWRIQNFNLGGGTWRARSASL